MTTRTRHAFVDDGNGDCAKCPLPRGNAKHRVPPPPPTPAQKAAVREDRAARYRAAFLARAGRGKDGVTDAELHATTTARITEVVNARQTLVDEGLLTAAVDKRTGAVRSRPAPATVDGTVWMLTAKGRAARSWGVDARNVDARSGRGSGSVRG